MQTYVLYERSSLFFIEVLKITVCNQRNSHLAGNLET